MGIINTLLPHGFPLPGLTAPNPTQRATVQATLFLWRSYRKVSPNCPQTVALHFAKFFLPSVRAPLTPIGCLGMVGGGGCASALVVALMKETHKAGSPQGLSTHADRRGDKSPGWLELFGLAIIKHKSRPFPSRCSWALSDEFIPWDPIPKHLSTDRKTFVVDLQLWTDQSGRLRTGSDRVGEERLLPSYPVLD